MGFPRIFVAQEWPRVWVVPRMWSPRGRPGVDKSLEAGSHKQAPNCHTTEKHRCMVLCEATDNPQAGKWPGPLAWRVCFNWLF